MEFRLTAPFSPTGDQPDAIAQLTAGIAAGTRAQTLLGVTGSGKTFTMANVIQNTQKPTLIVAHNKTLAAQLYQEFRDFFPDNAVSYFVSYYDYYQPEAYIPSTDTYIEKDASINDEIDKLRLSTTTNLLTRKDSIVVASVSCIYNLGSPVEYKKYELQLAPGQVIKRETLLLQLINLQYQQTKAELLRGTFRVRGDAIQVWPAYLDVALHLDTLEDTITEIVWIDPVSNSVHAEAQQAQLASPAPNRFALYPAKHYVIDPVSQEAALSQIEHDRDAQVTQFEKAGKLVEAYRLKQKVNYDLEMIREFGYTNGIENYSRYFDGRAIGQAPYTLLDYFQAASESFNTEGFLTIIDESHITLPQIKGMHRGDQARKKTLIEYGFRLPSALDNRPLQFDEFLERVPQIIAVSATPKEFEVSLSDGEVAEQIIRPTGLVDPNIELRPTTDQIADLVMEIVLRKQLGQRVLVTTLTKKMAEALTDYLNDTEKIDALIKLSLEKKAQKLEQSDTTYWNTEVLPIERMPVGPIDHIYYAHLRDHTDWASVTNVYAYPTVAYLHSDITTLDRSDILDDLRRGVYDVVVGINLLREGLDLPEVTLVAILDADKEGFLRSHTSLIQTMGRAARHTEGHAILYAENLTQSMHRAISETLRRRQIQLEYNQHHKIQPETIQKPIRSKMIENRAETASSSTAEASHAGTTIALSKKESVDLARVDPAALTPQDRVKLTKKLKRRMKQAARDLDYELAALIRDTIQSLTQFEQ